MRTSGEISAAINLIDVKKENLRKSWLHLQSQSPSPCTSTLKWSDFDSYFTTIRSSLHDRFHILQTLYPSSDTMSLLKSFCHNSDGLGLRRFIIHSPDRLSVLAQLPDAYRCAPDAAAMVLDAMVGFYGGNGKGDKMHLIKSGCVIMLEGLMHLKPEVTVELRDKAMKVAVQWNQERISSTFRDKKKDGALGFLLLVGAYGLIDGFSMDVLIDCFALVPKRRQTFDLCRKMIPADKINDLIQELINKDMHVAAVKFIIEFQKTDQFPPVDLLEKRKLMSERIVKEVHNKGKNHQNDVMMKEVNMLRSIIKCIDEYHLGSEYPKDAVVDLVKKLENEIGSRKRLASVPVVKQQQLPPSKLKKPKLNNVLQAAASPLPITREENVILLQQQAPDLLAAQANMGYPMIGGSSFYLPPLSGYYGNPNGEYGSSYYYPHCH